MRRPTPTSSSTAPASNRTRVSRPVFGRVPAVAGEVVVAVPLVVPEPLDEPEVCGLGDSGARLPSLDPELLEPEPDPDVPLDPDDPDPESELPKGSWYC